jgi:hypothetical protein
MKLGKNQMEQPIWNQLIRKYQITISIRYINKKSSLFNFPPFLLEHPPPLPPPVTLPSCCCGIEYDEVLEIFLAGEN